MGRAAAPVRAVVALALAVLVLSGTGGTGASWSQQVERQPGIIRSGGVTLTTGALRVELHSQQPMGSRTYASTSTCTPSTGYLECRVITTTVDVEALVPGDRVVITQPVTLAVSGTTLSGTLGVSATGLTSAARSAYSGSATVTTTVTSASGQVVTGTSPSLPVSVASGAGVGTSTVRTVIDTPPTAPSGVWGTAVQGQSLYGGTYTYTFTQNPGLSRGATR